MHLSEAAFIEPSLHYDNLTPLLIVSLHFVLQLCNVWMCSYLYKFEDWQGYCFPTLKYSNDQTWDQFNSGIGFDYLKHGIGIDKFCYGISFLQKQLNPQIINLLIQKYFFHDHPT